MRRISCCIIMLLCAISAHAQNITITGLLVKNELPAEIASWRPDAVNGIAIYSGQGRNTRSKLVIAIKKNGSQVCGNTMQTALLNDSFVTRIIKVSDVIAAAGNCRLEAGRYSICFQFFNSDNKAISREECKEFEVIASTSSPVEYQGPRPLIPVNNTIFPKTGGRRAPVQLSWTPVLPKPPTGDLVYTLRIYEIRNGQNAASAIRTEKPVLEKGVSGTQFTWQIPAEYDSQEKNFAWTIQGSTKDGKGYGSNNGISEPFVFGLASGGSPVNCGQVTISALNVLCGQGAGNYFISPVIQNGNGVQVSSWTVASNANLWHNTTWQAPGTAIPGRQGSVFTIPANGMITSNSIIFSNPPTSLTFTFTLTYSDGTICTQTITAGSLPNCAPVCPCGTWSPFDYRYYADGVMSNTVFQSLQAPVTSNSASITVAQGSRIYPQGLFNCVSGVINCATNYTVDLQKVGDPNLILNHNLGANLANFGHVYEYQFSTCGDYLLTIYPSCGPTNALTTCPPLVVQIHVDCTNSCTCGAWSSITATVGSGSPTSVSCGNNTAPIQMSSGNTIGLAAALSCNSAGSACNSSITADIYYQNGSLAAGNVPMPLTNFVIPNANYCGLLRVVLKGKCNNINCNDCVVFFNVNCNPPSCTCGSWQPVKVKIGNGALQSIVCNNNAAPISVAPGQPINVQSAGLVCPQTTCPASITAEVRIGGTTMVTYNSVPFTYTPDPQFCGQIEVVMHGNCGTTSCSDCVVRFDVACCECAPWGKIQYKKNNVSQPDINNTPQQTLTISAADVIMLTASQPCSPSGCGAGVTGSAKILKPDGSQYGTTISGLSISFPLPNTPTPCGIYKVVFEKNCGSQICRDTINVNVPCCDCAPWGKIGYKKNNVTQPDINNIPQQTLNITATDVITLTASQPCSPSGCGAGTPSSTRIIRPNGTAYSTVSGLIATFPMPGVATPCGLYKIIFEKNCGGNICRDTINVNVACCNCGSWINVKYNKNGIMQTALCNSTVTVDIMDNVTNMTAFHAACTPSGPGCMGKDTTFVYNEAGVLITKVPGLVVPNFTKTCQKYKIVFRQRCGSNVCDCTIFLKVDCCGDRKIRIRRVVPLPSGPWHIPGNNCITPGMYDHRLFTGLPSGTVINYKVFVGGVQIQNSSYGYGSPHPLFTVPQYSCTKKDIMIVYNWGQCTDTLRANICEPPCCNYINLANASSQSASYSGGNLNFTTVFTMTPAGITFNRVKAQILEISVGGAARPNANLVFLDKVSPGNPNPVTGQVNSAITGTGTSSHGNAIWFPSTITTTSNPFKISGQVRNVGPGGTIVLKIRYTFYRNTGTTCPETVCEKDVTINLNTSNGLPN